MKRLFILVILVGHCCLNFAQWPWQPCYRTYKYFNDTCTCETYDDWVLVFEDSFNGTSLDTEKWTSLGDHGQSWYCDDDPSYNTIHTKGTNLEISNGKLKLIAREDPGYRNVVPHWDPDRTLTCDGDPYGINNRHFDYTTGWIRSKQKFIHGKFEIRCKLPSIDDLWPAFWLYGECAQEIDVFEFMHGNYKVTYSYHRVPGCSGDDLHCIYDDLRTTNFSNLQHTFAVEWDDKKLTWSIDGTPVYSRSRYYTGNGQEEDLCGTYNTHLWEDILFPTGDIPMQVIANLRVKDNSGATFPCQLEIDWIRVYQRINSNNTVNICSILDINGSTVAGQEIVVGGTSCSAISIEDGEVLDLVAKDGITINKSFEVEEGARFSMKIDN